MQNWPTASRSAQQFALDGDAQNLSFEREFGKLIAQQDLLALVMEERTQRTVTRVLQNVATFVFIPI
jgi:hypothetical protein